MPGFGFGPAFRKSFSRRMGFPYGLSIPAPVKPGEAWDGTAASGFAIIPSDPARTAAKPVCRLLVPPRQTITDALMVGVFAAANNEGSLLDNLGLSHVDFHFEGTTVTVAEPTLRTFTRPDGSTYRVLGWWVALTKPALSEGLANLYVEAVPADPTMQSRVIGPFPFLLYDSAFDHDVTVAASGGGDFNTLADALSALRALDAQRPRIRITEAGTYDPTRAGGVYAGAGFCTIEATVPVTIAQSAPVSEATFTRFRPFYGQLRFKGENITLDFAQTLEFYTEVGHDYHWFDGITVTNSLGREALWRKASRTMAPYMVRDGSYFTDCTVTACHDAMDKVVLARGNICDGNWADLFDDARCAVANTITDHSSAWYYTNVDALTIRYTGAASTATVTLNGSNQANRTLRLYEDDVEVATFSIEVSAAAFASDTNYTIQNVVDFINSQADWTAALLDNTRYAGALTSPGSTTGAGFIKLDAKSADLTLPTHFDIHSDIYSLPNLGSVRENVVFAFNTGYGIDAQDIFVSGSGGMNDAVFINNALFNNIGTPDEGLSSQFENDHSHVVFAHNSLPTQKLLFREDLGYDGDAYCLVANNMVRDIDVSGGGALDVDIRVSNNHLSDTGDAPAGGEGTSIGGDHTSLFANAVSGDFSPAGLLLTNLKPPVMKLDLTGRTRQPLAAAGALQ